MNRSVPVIPSATAPWATDMIPRICAVLPEIQALFTASTFSRKHFHGTEALLAEEHLLTPAHLILDSHSHLKQYIDHPIRFFVFNLGYLPDGDPTVITKGTSTLEAIEAALSITETGGGGAVLSYYGHPGGAEEKAAVEEFLHNPASKILFRHED